MIPLLPIGELVVVSHWIDFKMEDATKLGILRDVRDGHFYIEGDGRGYRHCRRVNSRCLCKALK